MSSLGLVISPGLSNVFHYFRETMKSMIISFVDDMKLRGLANTSIDNIKPLVKL